MLVCQKPLPTHTTVIFTVLLDLASDAKKRADISVLVVVVQCARVVRRHNDLSRRISVAPPSVAFDSHEAMMKFIRSVVHERNVSNDDAASMIDVHTTKRQDRESSQTILIKIRVHPVTLGNEQSTVTRLDYAARAWSGCQYPRPRMERGSENGRIWS